MNGIYSCIIAVSMYSKIPMPAVEWTEERMRHVMCFFPFVGLAQGGVLGLWFYLGLDGFMDTMDAIHSYGEREKNWKS